MIKAIIFDLDNTLYWDERANEEALEAVCGYAADRAADLSPDNLIRAVVSEAELQFAASDFFEFASSIEVTALEALWARFDAASTEGDERFEAMRQAAVAYRFNVWNMALLGLGCHDPKLAELLVERYLNERRARAYIYSDTLDTLTWLSTDYRLLLLTNGTPDLQQEKVDSIAGLSSFFEHIVISGDYGVGKPAESIFRHALELLGVEPEEAVMVGDNPYTDIIGANRTGIPSVWVNRYGAPLPDSIKPTFIALTLSELPGLLLSGR
ncbi:HAD family hydrolase [Paenibacillus sp. YIM B09110]|uniref:HAD family hydrolase n=1 Tax=Paenibacillus sp. YIM B09110 TaxID=3126102 RepID=UPI00301E4FC9